MTRVVEYFDIAADDEEEPASGSPAPEPDTAMANVPASDSREAMLDATQTEAAPAPRVSTGPSLGRHFKQAGKPVVGARPKLVSATEEGTWSLRPTHDDLAGHYSAIASDSGLGERDRQAAMLYSVAEGHLDMCNFEEALKTGNEALDLFSVAHDLQGMADSSRLIILAHCGREERKLANDFAKEYLAIFERKTQHKTHQQGIAKMLLSIAEVNCDKRGSKNREIARTSAERALEIFKSLKDEKMQAKTLLALSNIYLKDNTSPKETCGKIAFERASEARRLYRKLGDRLGEAIAVHTTATAHFAMKQPEFALKASQEALNIFRQLGDKQLEVFELQCMSRWQHHSAKHQDAVLNVEKSLSLAMEIEGRRDLEASAIQQLVSIKGESSGDAALRIAKDGLRRMQLSDDTKAEIEALSAVVSAHLANGNIEEALVAARNVKAKCGQIGDTRGEHLALQTVADLELRSGLINQALNAAQKSLEYFQKMQDKKERVNSLLLLARVRMVLGETQKALDLAQEAQLLAIAAGYSRGEVSSSMAACGAFADLKQLHEALAAAGQAQRVAAGIGDKRLEAEVLTVITDVQVMQDDYEAAIRSSSRVLALSQELQERPREVKALLLDARCRMKALLELHDKTDKQISPLHRDWVKMRSHSKRAVMLARKSRDRKLVAAAQFNLAEVLLLASEIGAAVGAASESADLARRAGDKAKEAHALDLSATAHHRLEQWDESWNSAGRALDIYRDIGDELGEKRMSDFLQNTLVPHYEALKPKPSIPTPSSNADAPAVKVTTVTGGAANQLERGSIDLASRKPVDLSEGVSEEIIGMKILEILRENLNIDTDEYELDEGFMTAGVTSGSSVILNDVLRADFPGVNLPATVMFDYPNPRELSALMYGQMTA